MKNGNYEIRSPILAPDELASLSGTFNQMAAHIQKNIETLRQFVSDAAHEIRTPLTSLRADLNLALTENTTKKSQPIVKRSLEQVERLDQLSRDLLDLSKLESRNAGTEMGTINLADLLAELSEIHASAAEQAGIAFQLQLPPNQLIVNGDKSQLYRAVGNLLDNAVKFTPSAGRVTLTLRRMDGSALIEIEDTGIGIPADERELLFKRFHRGKNTQRYPGSGLGLAIAKAIVESHQGEIGLMPDISRTIFFIKLPLIDRSA
jgi:two-component system sensor histidine kinase BaeS